MSGEESNVEKKPTATGKENHLVDVTATENIQNKVSVNTVAKSTQSLSQNKAQSLPQTGNKENDTLTLILGLGSVLGALITGSWSLRKKKDNEK
ncbi:LPXTG cell wall anchor domain-containing protein [uncultured Lactobacillus sp.]|uniref:LPXTG cell wall anchor domain-containing protein n=1 Tax=uncultured Lactobacillus sp. TaxID=153152 RepID=UPI002638B9BE|nr:LPXTG cell wall anchor domain-containing protein [uncultured Lactobacillus sp.]